MGSKLAEPNKWSWAMDYCRNKGIPAEEAWAWEEAEKAFEDAFPSDDTETAAPRPSKTTGDYEGSDVMEHLESVLLSASQARHRKVAQLMKDARRQRGLTQAELADLLGVTQSWVSKVEAGSNHTLENIVNYFEAMNYKVKISICTEQTVEL